MPHAYRIAVDQAVDLAQELAPELKGGEILALTGPLGAGKTTFTQALGRALGVRRRITSPTFIILQQFPARLPNRKKSVALYHLDLYRTRSFREVTALGITEVWGR